MLITSCSESDNDFSGFPLTYEEMVENYDYFISVGEYFDNKTGIEVDWTANVEPIDYELRLGGMDLLNITWVYDEEEEIWRSNIYIDKDSLDIDNHSFDFGVIFNGNHHVGILNFTPEITCESLVEFNFVEDLEICWEAAYEPQLYNLNLDHNWMGDMGFENRQYNYQLSGNTTSYIFESSLFSGICNYEAVHVYIKAVNYYQDNSFMIYSFTKKLVTYDNFMGR
jgi:hypothetical protein